MIRCESGVVTTCFFDYFDSLSYHVTLCEVVPVRNAVLHVCLTFFSLML